MLGLFERLRSKTGQKQRTRKDQKRELISDVASGKLDRTDDDVLLELDQLDMTPEELETAVLAYQQRAKWLEEKIGLDQANEDVSNCNQQLAALQAKLDADIDALRKQFALDRAALDVKMSSACSRQTVGSNAFVKLMESLPEDTKAKLAPIEARTAELMRQRDGLVQEKSNAQQLGICTAARSAEISKAMAAVERELQSIAVERAEIERTGLV